MSDLALELAGVTKEFPGVRALDNVTLRVRRGEIHALVGENGAGKSTLMKILGGIYPHGSFEGGIRIRGEPFRFHSPHDAQRKGIGFVPQEIGIIENLTVAENIFVGRWTGGRLVNFRSLCARAEPLLGRIGAVLDARQVVATLSASQRQLVMLARALAPSPVVLILDEPTSALTQAETNNLFGIVRSLRGEGGSIVFISHKLEEVFALADRATVLRDGAVIAEFERSQFTADDIITAMVGRHMERRFPPRETAIGTEEVLRVRDLTIPHPHLANRNVVEGLNFALRRGEILGLAGLVGSGRSETLNALYGMVPCRGRIVVEGKPVRISTPRHAKAAGIGLMTEDRKRNGLLFNLGIRANITINSLGAVSRFGVVRPALENKTARGYFDQMSIAAPSLETAVGALSGGNQQKVLLAKVLGSQPKALLLDEPTKGVDVGAKFEIYKMMRRLAGAGVGIIFVSSELPELIAISDRVIVLANRRLVCELPQLRLDQEQIMLAATGGDPGGAVPSTT